MVCLGTTAIEFGDRCGKPPDLRLVSLRTGFALQIDSPRQRASQPLKHCRWDGASGTTELGSKKPELRHRRADDLGDVRRDETGVVPLGHAPIGVAEVRRVTGDGAPACSRCVAYVAQNVEARLCFEAVETADLSRASQATAVSQIPPDFPPNFRLRGGTRRDERPAWRPTSG
jgi:hypothetical protein